MTRARFQVGLVVHTFNMGGLERCVSHLLNHLDRSRFEPKLVCLGQNGTASSWLTVTDVPVVELHKPPGKPGPRFFRRLRDSFRDQHLELVHSHNWGTLVETAVAASLAGNLVHVHSERGTVLGGSTAKSLWRRQINAWVLRKTLGHCDAVLAVDESVAARVEAACGFRQSRIQVIPNGVPRPACDAPPAARARIRQSLGIAPGETLLCSLGRLVPVKGFDLLISAVAQSRKRFAHLHLVLIGDGPLREELESQARREGVEHVVHFAGRQSQVGDWLAASDLFVNSSRSEGMSQALVEAMTFGLPLVVTDVGGNAGLAGGAVPCGLIVPPEDSAALAGAIERMVGDEQLAGACGRAGEERAQRCFSLPGMIRRYEELYEKLLEDRSPRRHERARTAGAALATTDTREET
jgi:glycosyltransferase involved in cell wall biosynthesis